MKKKIETWLHSLQARTTHTPGKTEVLICTRTWKNLENTLWKKSVTKDHILHESIPMKCQEWVYLQRER
jgi:hypothetical protein